jgi:hypothetical protein
VAAAGGVRCDALGQGSHDQRVPAEGVCRGRA